MPNLPSFLVVGAAKSGTTSLHRYLRQNPQLFLPSIKETWFFSLYGNSNQSVLRYFPELPTNWETYQACYAAASPDQICGEITPSYLYYHDLAIKNIQRFHPDWKSLKIVIILREPIAKVISHYRYVQKNQLDPEQLDLGSALQAEERRRTDANLLYDLLYTGNTSYYEQVKAYKSVFPNTRVWLFDQLKSDTLGLLDEITAYLGADPFSYQLDKIYNRSKAPKVARNASSAWLLKNMSGLKKIVPTSWRAKIKSQLLEEEKMGEEVLPFLKQKFKPEVEKLQDLLGTDLSHWLANYR